mmetsp:Transcript_7956/g.17950  ORF Transcript_7956/g.17950 Transcript_7956/m.17950 type:complete len:123 (+) Transcript_7956:305-673(+)
MMIHPLLIHRMATTTNVSEKSIPKDTIMVMRRGDTIVAAATMEMIHQTIVMVMLDATVRGRSLAKVADMGIRRHHLGVMKKRHHEVTDMAKDVVLVRDLVLRLCQNNILDDNVHKEFMAGQY